MALDPELTVAPYPGAPTGAAVIAYLEAAGISYDADQLEDAIAAEVDDQLGRCRLAQVATFDADGLVTYVATYPPALSEALKRRVAHNLAVRPLPLGVQATVTDAAALSTNVGGLDAEVRRLEARWRKRLLG